MTYLYNEGSEPTAWVSGYSSGGGSQSKESNYFRLYAIQEYGTDRTYVTNVTIDLTNVYEICVSWVGVASNSPYGSVLSAGTNKTTRARLDEAEFTIRKDSWSRKTDTLDVSGLFGEHYVKVAVEGSNDNPGSSLLYVYQVWTHEFIPQIIMS